MPKHLSDEDLIEYYTLMKNLSKRNMETKIKGSDVKFLYHTVRLLDEAEQILSNGTIDLQRNREHLKAIRRGDVSEEDIIKWASDKEAALEKVYQESKLQHSPDEKVIKQLLLDCLEEHYGDLSVAIVNPDKATIAMQKITNIIEKYNK